MGLRCLLGHDFGEPELRREREEDGNEVVTTVTEVKTCARCGETQVVSENTEVTTMKQLTDEATVVGDEPTGPDADSDRETPVTGVEGTGPDGDIDGDDAVIIGNSPEDGDDTADIPAEPGAADARTPETKPGDTTASESETEADVEAGAAGDDGGAELIDEGPSGAGDDDSNGSLERDDGEYAAYPEAETTEPTADEERAETDDGVILDEEGEDADDRERGAWPDVDESDEGGEEPTPWPEHGGEDEGFSAELDDGNTGDVEFGGGLTPEAADQPDRR